MQINMNISNEVNIQSFFFSFLLHCSVEASSNLCINSKIPSPSKSVEQQKNKGDYGVPFRLKLNNRVEISIKNIVRSC